MRAFGFTKIKIVPYVVLACGMCISFLLLWKHEKDIEHKNHARFEAATTQITFSILNKMSACRGALYAGAAFFEASNEVNREEWKTFVKTLRVDKNLRGIFGIGFSEIITPQQKEKHIAKIRAEGFLDYAIWSDGDRDIYSSVIYIEPLNEQSKMALGYDMFSEGVRKDAMQRAARSGEVALSGKIQLLFDNEANPQPAFIMYVPIYKKGLSLNTPDERMSALAGFVYAPFMAKDLMDDILSGRREYIELEIFDGKAIDYSRILFDSKPEHTEKIAFATSTSLDIDSRPWTLNFKALDKFLKEAYHDNHSYILLFGFAISFALFVIVYLLIELKGRAEALAAKMTERLSTSEERFRLALEGAGDGIWDWNIKTGETYYSQNWKKIRGYEKWEVGIGEKEWEANVYQDDAKGARLAMESYLKEGAGLYSQEYRILHKDGSIKWVLDKGVVTERDERQNPIRMIGSNIDITHSKEAQLQLEKAKERFMLAVNGSNDGIWDWDIDTNSLFLSKKWKEMLGYEEAELKDEFDTFYGLLYEEDMAKVMALVEQYFENKLEKYAVKFRMKHKNGSLRWILARGEALRRSDGKPYRMAGSHTDITDRKTHELELEKLVEVKATKIVEQEKILIQQSKMAMMGEMIGAIAHQWRQPLNSLGIMIQDVESSYEYGELDGEYIKSFRQKAMDKIHTMSKTIDDFRHFFSPNKKKEEFFIEDAIFESLNILDSQLKIHGINIVFDAGKNKKHSYVCHKNELKHVLLNILANAKDAILEKKLRSSFIKISVDIVDDNLMIKIEDSAGGIREDILNLIFDAHFTTKEEGKGTGIGLNMSKQIVEESMGGKISVSNTQNGAEFTVCLPL